jgi:hypothetical protein
MINYTDYYNLTMAEVLARIQNDWLQTSKKLISIETLPSSNIGYKVRVWFRE